MQQLDFIEIIWFFLMLCLILSVLIFIWQVTDWIKAPKFSDDPNVKIYEKEPLFTEIEKLEFLKRDVKRLGKLIEKNHCINCNNKREPNDVFCYHCGGLF